MPELAGVAAGRLLTADPETAAGCRIQIAAALLQPCADRAAVAVLELAGKRCFRGICCSKGDFAVRDSRGDPDQSGAGTGTGGGVGNNIDGSGIAVDDDILFAIDKRIRLDIGHTVTGRRIDRRGTAAADRQMDGPLAGAVRAVVLDRDIHAACSQTLYRDRTGAARRNVDRRVALDLRDAAVAEGRGKVIGAVGRSVLYVDDERFACGNADAFFGTVAGCRCDLDRLIRNRGIHRRGTAAADRQMDDAFSGVLAAICVAVLDGDVHSPCSQTGHRERTGTARRNVDRRIALDLRDAAVAEGCGKVVGAAGGTVGHRNDQRIAGSDRGRDFRVVGCRGDFHRATHNRRIDDRRIFGRIIAADHRRPDTVGFCYIVAGSITISELQGSGIIGGGNGNSKTFALNVPAAGAIIAVTHAAGCAVVELNGLFRTAAVAVLDLIDFSGTIDLIIIGIRHGMVMSPQENDGLTVFRYGIIQRINNVGCAGGRTTAVIVQGEMGNDKDGLVISNTIQIRGQSRYLA